MRYVRTLLVGAVVIAAGYGAWRYMHRPPPAVAEAPSVPVTVVTAKQGELPVYLQTIGSVRALNAADIRPQVGGVLVQVPVKEGDAVKTGQVLAIIDPRPLQAALDKANAQLVQDKAQLSNAELDRQRYATLAKSDFASRQQLDTQVATVQRLEGTVQADQAAIDDAKINLDFAVLKAPFDGKVGIRRVDPGNLLTANGTTAIMTIVQDKPTTVIFNLPDTELGQVQAAQKKGQPVVLAQASGEKTVLEHGTLKVVDNAVDSSSGTIALRAEFPNQDDALTAGQFVNVQLQVDTASGIVIPHVAIQHGQGGLYVFTVGPDKSVKRADIKLAYDDGDQAVIADGLSDGANVVTNGQTRIGTGTKVAFNQDKGAKPEQSAQR